MIDVATAVKIYQGRKSELLGQRGGGSGGGGGLELGELGGEVVEGVDICGVVVVVVEFHNFAGDGGFEGGVVVYDEGISLKGFAGR